MALFDDASLVVTPNGYKEGTLYSIKPTSGLGDMTVVRATTATRVNSAGLIELVPYNLMQYSEDFSNAIYTKSNVSVTSNSTTAPNGQTTADTVTDTASGGLVLQTSQVNVNAGTTVTFSQYVKRSNNDWVYLGIARSGATTYGEVVGFFNLATGATGSNVTYGAGVFLGINIENVGNGWYRCSMTASIVDAVSYIGYSGNANANGVPFVSSIGDEFFAWGAQLVTGTLPKDYLRTETRLNIPRLDYSNGSCPSLLVEPQRTNLALYSEQFDNNTYWSKVRATVTTNATTSPDGTNNADLLTDTTFTNDINYTEQATSVSGNLITMSIFVKKGTAPYIQFGFYDNAFHGFVVNTTTWASSFTFGSATNFTATNYGNGWYRLTMTKQAATNFIYSSLSVSQNSNGSAYNGTSSLNAYFWGAQLEVGSYPTSYIPTTSAAVTRNADVISKTGISSLIGQTEGVLFLDLFASAKNDDTNTYGIWLVAGTASENFQIYNLGTTLYWYARNTGGIIIDQTANETLVEGTRYKIAFAYKSGDYALYINGVQKRTSANANVPVAVSQFNLSAGGYGASPAIVKNEYNSAIFFPTRLTNAELISLTTI